MKQTEIIGNYTLKYKVEGDGVMVTDVSPKPTGEFSVPATLGGYPVTALGEYLFSFCTSLAAVGLPSCLKDIGKCAFARCNVLVSVPLPEGLKTIGHRAFSDCETLENIHIPDTVTVIGERTFDGCSKLDFNIPPQLECVGDIPVDSIAEVLRFPPIWMRHNLFTRALRDEMAGTLMRFGHHAPLEHYRYGAFGIYTGNPDTSPSTLIKLIEAAERDPDPDMGAAAIRDITGHPNCDRTVVQRATSRLPAMGTPPHPSAEPLASQEDCNDTICFKHAYKESEPEGEYLVIDVSGGPDATTYPVSYLMSEPSGGWTDEYKTTKVVLRRVPAGTFIMGSPEGEIGRDGSLEEMSDDEPGGDHDETQRQVTLTKDFFIGVFPVTQRQWERVMGDWPSYFFAVAYRDTRPVESVSYYDIREKPDNTPIHPNWPQSAAVGANSFMGKLRTKTGIRMFDLPTEAQWEYACRAGTTTALNSGKNLTDTDECSNVSEVGIYDPNNCGNDPCTCPPSSCADWGTAKVGSYLPNAWGLYDMHGNVWECCKDWYTKNLPGGEIIDPQGPLSGSQRVVRGGAWCGKAYRCRSAYRACELPSWGICGDGFRIALSL